MLKKNNTPADILLQKGAVIRVFESIAEAVMVVDKSGKIIYVNNRFEDLFLYTRSEVLGREIEFLLGPDIKEKHRAYMNKFFENPQIRPMGIGMDLNGIRKDGSILPLEISLSHIESDSGNVGLAFINDISKRKAIENELKEKNKELDSFAGILAHDLRNSVNSISSFSQLLVDDFESLSSEEIKDILKDILHGSQAMGNVIHELLLFARYKKENIKLSTLNMEKVISNSLLRLKLNIEKNKAQIKLNKVSNHSIGYAPWVEEVWYNYFSNALSYGGHPPVIEVGDEPAEPGVHKFWVKDNGNGITKKNQSLVFEENSSEKNKIVKGHGLGLPLVKNIITKLGGTVGVESEPGKGSKFYFTLPLKKT